MLKEFNFLKFDTDNFIESKDEVIREIPFSIFIDGRHFITAMISPEMEKEFVIGHLFSETIIKDLEEIESLQIKENIAKVITINPLNVLVLASRKLIVSGCGGSSSFLDELRLPKINSNLKIEVDDIFNGVRSISNSNLHKITGGVHTVGLFNKKEAICISEDIGRHNALDKVIGYGLIKNIDFKDAFLVCTGRISSEMTLKSSVANIPIIASKSATTSLAIEIAEKIGLTIISFVRGKKMNVYTNVERIVNR